MLGWLWDDLCVLFSIHFQILCCIAEFFYLLFSLFRRIIADSVKDPESAIYPGTRLSYHCDYTKGENTCITTDSYIMDREPTILVIREIQLNTHDPSARSRHFELVAGCFDSQNIPSTGWHHVRRGDPEYLNLKTGILLAFDGFDYDINWRQFLTTEWKDFPPSLKQTLKAWLLCCKRAPLLILYKDLRLLVCEYLIADWKAPRNTAIA